jgi:hypothetical protein
MSQPPSDELDGFELNSQAIRVPKRAIFVLDRANSSASHNQASRLFHERTG